MRRHVLIAELGELLQLGNISHDHVSPNRAVHARQLVAGAEQLGADQASPLEPSARALRRSKAVATEPREPRVTLEIVPRADGGSVRGPWHERARAAPLPELPREPVRALCLVDVSAAAELLGLRRVRVPEQLAPEL